MDSQDLYVQKSEIDLQHEPPNVPVLYVIYIWEIISVVQPLLLQNKVSDREFSIINSQCTIQRGFANIACVSTLIAS